jgi:hypothetical protein
MLNGDFRKRKVARNIYFLAMTKRVHRVGMIALAIGGG